MTKFTSLPWVSVEESPEMGGKIGQHFVLDANMLTICEIQNMPDNFDPRDPRYAAHIEEQAANARLISYAPDLFGALTKVVPLLESGGAVGGDLLKTLQTILKGVENGKT